MAKSKPTLFDQYITNTRAQQPSWKTSPSVRWVAIAASILVAALCMPSVSRFIISSPVSSVPSVGFRWNGAPIIANQTLTVLKPAAVYESECAQARARAEPVYEFPMQWRTLRMQLLSIFDSVAAAIRPARIRAHLQARYAQWVDSLLDSSVPTDSVVVSSAPTVLLRFVSGAYRRVPATALLSRSQLNERMQRFLRTLPLADSLIPPVLARLSALTVAHYSLERSKQEQDMAAAQVPRTYGIVLRGQTIVAPGDIITESIAARLAAYQHAASVEATPERIIRGFLSGLVRAVLLCGIVWLFLMRTRSTQQDDNSTVVVVATLLVLTVLQSWLSKLLPSTLAPEFLVLMPASVMLVTVLYDIRLAFVFATSVSLLHIAIRSSDVTSGIALLIASIAGALGVRSLQSRYQFIRAMLLVAGGSALSLLIALLESEITPSMLVAPALASIANAVVSPLLVYGALLVADRLLDIPTDLRLLELDSLTHPLLVKLRQVAPGTYQHTLTVANLAEHAALAIGANPLLARVGAYFHDIGKMRKPEYFAENQIELSNKHRELSPLRSAAIIRSHIEEGIELALEYGLPWKVIEFIPMHHGTSLIRHFYAIAVEESQTTHAAVNEADFRYPGPKPKTKETAIVMLADVAEAIARTVDTPSRVAERLEEVFREKISDGQLDECPLTLDEIATIRRLFTDLITGMLHGRPEYKSLAQNPESLTLSSSGSSPTPSESATLPTAGSREQISSAE